MTEHLSTLLHDEAARLHVPAAPVEGVLASGRSMRRRRRVRTAMTSAVAALALIATATALLGLDSSDTTPQPARLSDPAAYDKLGAWASGDEVHIGNHTATVAGAHELQYTRSGVVVAGDDGYVLVSPDGAVEPLDLELVASPVAPPTLATDPTTSNIAYVRAVGGERSQAVVRDLASGDETAVGRPFRTHDTDGVTWISGDLLSFLRDGDGRVVDWRTGRPSRVPQRGLWHASDVSVDYDADGTWTLTTFAGETLLTVPSNPASSYGTLSPDGRYFAVSDLEPTTTVYEVATGTKIVIEGRTPATLGWTPDGHLIGRTTPSSNTMEVCDPGTGQCTGVGSTVTGELTLVAGTPGTSL